MCLLQLLDISRVKRSVPPELTILPLLPGKTLGGIYLAKYGAGSTLAYHELIVVSALVRRGCRLGAWVSHVYVDDPRSVAGGREIWGLPKRLAAFSWAQPSGPVVVRGRRQPLCILRLTRRPPLARLPVFLPAFSRKEGELMWFRGAGTARLGVTRAKVDVPAASPFSALGFKQGLGVRLHSLEVLVRPPVRLTRR